MIVVRNVKLENATTTHIFGMMDVNVHLNVKLIAGIGSSARMIAKMNAKVLSLKNSQKLN